MANISIEQRVIRDRTVRFTIFFLSAIGIVSGLLLDNGAVLKDLIDNVKESFLPGF